MIMRIFARTLAILAAACVVSAGAFALVQSSYAQSLFSAGPARGAGFEAPRAAALESEADGASATPSEGAAPGRHAHEGGRSPSLFGAVEMLKNLAIISIIVALVSLVKRAARGRRPSPPPTLAAPT
jgi:hypothetical protein